MQLSSYMSLSGDDVQTFIHITAQHVIYFSVYRIVNYEIFPTFLINKFSTKMSQKKFSFVQNM